MIDLTPQITQAQIAFALAVIAFVLVFGVFGKKSRRANKK